jgi:hypothetical protein
VLAALPADVKEELQDGCAILHEHFFKVLVRRLCWVGALINRLRAALSRPPGQ